MWVIDHGTEVSNQQTEGELTQDHGTEVSKQQAEGEQSLLSVSRLTVQVPQLKWHWGGQAGTPVLLSGGSLHWVPPLSYLKSLSGMKQQNTSFFLKFSITPSSLA